MPEECVSRPHNTIPPPETDICSTTCKPNCPTFDPRSKRCGGIFDVANRRDELKRLEELQASPEFWNNQTEAQKVIGQAKALNAFLQPFGELEAKVEDFGAVFELAEGADEEEKAMLQAEANEQLEAISKLRDDLELKSLLGGELDAANAYLHINAGAGGTESCDWADMMLRMYLRYCERQGFKADLLDRQPGDEAGIKSASLYVSGPYAYGMLQAERGVHRLVRISPFDSAARRHTSFASLDTVAEVDDDIEIDVPKKDVREDTYRASGAGGQHVNKTDSAIRLTHLPTGIVVQCQAERSQHSNRDKAWKMLMSRLHELERDKQRQAQEQFYGDKGDIAWGNQIRSYVLQPYTMVKDLRSRHEAGNAQGVLDGDLQPFIEAYLKHQRKSEGGA